MKPYDNYADGKARARRLVRRECLGKSEILREIARWHGYQLGYTKNGRTDMFDLASGLIDGFADVVIEMELRRV